MGRMFHVHNYVRIWFLLCQICLLAEELGNHEGRLGWGEGSFGERGTRGRQADPRHQPKIRWGAPTPKGGGTGVTGAADRSAQRAVSRAESFPHKGEIRSLSRIHHAEPRPAHARPKAPRGTLSF